MEPIPLNDLQRVFNLKVRGHASSRRVKSSASWLITKSSPSPISRLRRYRCRTSSAPWSSNADFDVCSSAASWSKRRSRSSGTRKFIAMTSWYKPVPSNHTAGEPMAGPGRRRRRMLVFGLSSEALPCCRKDLPVSSPDKFHCRRRAGHLVIFKRAPPPLSALSATVGWPRHVQPSTHLLIGPWRG
jgi:hypothetical protein